MNWQFLPALKFSPKELLLGLVVNTKPMNVNQSVLPITEQDVSMQMAYIGQQQLDGYAEAVVHTLRRKSAFDKKVLARKPGEVKFIKGQLVQVYQSDLDDTFKTEHKILPKWSPPYHVITRELNSYTLETLTGIPINGHFSMQRLQRFLLREGTELVRVQKEVEEKCQKENEELEKAELLKIEEDRERERAAKGQQATAPVEQDIERETQPMGGENNEDNQWVDEEQAKEEDGVEEREWMDDEDE